MKYQKTFDKWQLEQLDNILRSTGEALLEGAGTISHAQALEKAKREYQKYQVQNLSPVEEAYLQAIKDVEKTARKKSKDKGEKNGSGRC